MTVDESKALKNGTRVYWQGDAADSGIVTETSWDAASDVIDFNQCDLAISVASFVHYGVQASKSG